MFIVMQRHNYNKVLVCEKWRSSILLGMYTNSKAKEFFFHTPVCQKAVQFFFNPSFTYELYGLKSQLQRAVVFNWMKDELREGIFVDPVDCRTKVCTHMCKKDGPSFRARTYETHCKFSVFSLISVSCHFSCQRLVTIFLWNHNVQFYTFVIWQVFPTSWHLNPVLS